MGGWLGFGTTLIWIDPNYFGSLCSNPNKIQTNDMVGGVVYFCLFSEEVTTTTLSYCLTFQAIIPVAFDNTLIILKPLSSSCVVYHTPQRHDRADTL